MPGGGVPNGIGNWGLGSAANYAPSLLFWDVNEFVVTLSQEPRAVFQSPDLVCGGGP